MSTDVRHDCRGCSHSNDSHDPLIGCLYPMCMCANKYPGRYLVIHRETPELIKGVSTVAAQAARDALSRVPTTYGRPRSRKRQRRFWRATWRVLRWLLGSVALAVVAGLMLAGALLIAGLILLARGEQ